MEKIIKKYEKAINEYKKLKSIKELLNNDYNKKSNELENIIDEALKNNVKLDKNDKYLTIVNDKKDVLTKLNDIEKDIKKANLKMEIYKKNIKIFLVYIIWQKICKKYCFELLLIQLDKI